MSTTLYKTHPRLFLVIFYLASIEFCGVVGWACWTANSSNSTSNNPFIIKGFACVLFALTAIFLYSLLKMKRVKLTADHFIVAYCFLPFRKRCNYPEIVELYQTGKDIYKEDSNMFSSTQYYIYTDYTTVIQLAEGKIILNNIGSTDFNRLKQNFYSIKGKNLNLKSNTRKSRIGNYLTGNLGGILVLIIFLCANAFFISAFMGHMH